MKHFTGIRGVGKNVPRTEKPDLRCQVCGDAILGNARSNAEPRKYCSQSCSAIGQRLVGEEILTGRNKSTLTQ
jgi:hypothetical protein